ncbi:MAG TPA: 5-(carboxyamino)imidazole ribonucleotide mutase [Erysipelotrichaceae bacterium]|nr:5-(carboxyamino)imidazole ribonucleotide mutase [Erysipelotrichaceae bacterium]
MDTPIRVSVVMGSYSDYETVKEGIAILDDFNVAYEKKIVSAHRTPEDMFKYAKEAKDNGIHVIIAAAGGAAHLPGMIASLTTLPVIGVPIQSRALNGLDSLLSIVQMPAGVPVITTAIGVAGAKNAALAAIRILSLNDEDLAKKLQEYQLNIAVEVRDTKLP